tara:strand:- start:240 stop:704 length:465 start_codon:yes stop_codon:yes gene_type:complete
MIKINVIVDNISWKKYIKKPNSYLNTRAKILNKKNKLIKSGKFTFSIMLSSNIKIKNLNKKFRKKDKTTDVLSFPFYEKKVLNSLVKEKKEIYLGDIIINLSKIKDKNNSKKFSRKFNDLWIHGLSHLFGYTHKGNKDYKTMLKVEKNFSNLIN